jgi:molybdenum cofactor biosynthesis enzyme MoaA
MSCYESMSGNGLLMKQDIKELKKQLINSHNKQLSSTSDRSINKATNRTSNFPFFYEREGVSVEGYVDIDMNTGRFVFSTDYNNHTVDDLEKHSLTYQTLFRFINKLEVKGKKYGAETYYKNEYHEDEFGNESEGNRCYYGGWTPNWQRKILQ